MPVIVSSKVLNAIFQNEFFSEKNWFNIRYPRGNMNENQQLCI